MYTDGYWGGWGEQSATNEQRIKIAREKFDLVSSSHHFIEPVIDGDDPTIKKFMAWWAADKVLGKDKLLYVNQGGTGSCVGASAGNLLHLKQCIEIANGEREEFKYIFFPYHYGAGRRKNGNRSKGEGSNGGPQAAAIMEIGSIPDDLNGLPQQNIHKNELTYFIDESVQVDWSGQDRDGTWDYEKYLTEGKTHNIQTTTRITNVDKAAEFILNGHILQVCSSIGYGNPDSAGFARQDRSWGHAMCICGVDLTHSTPYFIIINSWGNYTGRVKDFETGEIYPIGSIRCRFEHVQRALSQGDSYAYSSYNGFPARKLDRSKFNLV